MISLRLWLRRARGKSRRKGAAMKSAFGLVFSSLKVRNFLFGKESSNEL